MTICAENYALVLVLTQSQGSREKNWPKREAMRQRSTCGVSAVSIHLAPDYQHRILDQAWPEAIWLGHNQRIAFTSTEPVDVLC